MKPASRTPGVPPVGFGGAFSANTKARGSLPGKVKYGLLAVGTVAAVTFAMAWNPPTSSVHEFTAASDYRADRESGCTNSGEGCHGRETEYSDFNAYHPDAECTSCHEYQGVGCIPCHAPREHECALCHDGSMEKAPDRVRITDPFPQGHYRETTHTAMGTAMDKPTRIIAGGRAKATCAECHSRDLRAAHTAVPAVEGSTYGTDIGCGECHNDVRAFGQAEVLADWEKRSCEACHRIGSSSPMHSTTSLDAVDAENDFGCTDSGSGCHEQTDLHLLHADAPKDCSGSAEEGEPVCHALDAEAKLPTAKGCGGDAEGACHRSEDERGYRHEAETERHSPESSAPSRITSFEGVACGECHAMDPDGSSLTVEHQRANSAMASAGGDACEGCHNNEAAAAVIENEWSDRDSAASCTGCHDGDGIESPHAGDLNVLHSADPGSGGCAATGPGCHAATDISSIGTPAEGGLHSACVRCHDRTPSDGNQDYTPGARTCGEGRDCHSVAGEFDPETSVHQSSTQKVDGRDKKHAAGQAMLESLYEDEASGLAVACGDCHAGSLGIEHSRSSNSIRSDACANCHNASAGTARTVKTDWPERTGMGACTAACHDGESAPAPHGRVGVVHTAVELGPDGEKAVGRCGSSGCHGTADVRKLHAAEGCGIAGCHRSTGDIGGTVMTCGGSADSGSCHAGVADHAGNAQNHSATEIDSYGGAVAGTCERAGCHSTVDVRSLHGADGCQIAGCHSADGPGAMTCGGSEEQGGSCHTGDSRHVDRDAKHAATELDAYGEPAAGTCQTPGCHSSVDVRVLHTSTFCSTAGCHVEGGPTYMTCGGPEGQAGSCHGGTSRHPDRVEKHQAVEYAPDGAVSPGACQTTGCHASVDVRTLHRQDFCQTAGCHVEGGPTYMKCGGAPGQPNCHIGFEAAEHSQSHSAALEGTVGGTEYGPGENVGCLGECHDSDLAAEHRIRLLGGGLEGGGSTACSICHEETLDSGSYAGAVAVTSAIARGDRRCIACHSGGSDSGEAVASPTPACTATIPLGSVENVMTAASAVKSVRPSAEHMTGGSKSAAKRSGDTTAAVDSKKTTEPSAEPEDSTTSEEPDANGGGSCTQKGSDETVTATTLIPAATDEAICLECHTVSD